MDDTLLRTLLFDFYGETLTEKQREYYDLHYNQDLSLQEISEMCGASRQAVWDVIRRGEQSLREIENKTGLVARAMRRNAALAELGALAEKLPECPEKALILEKLRELAD